MNNKQKELIEFMAGEEGMFKDSVRIYYQIVTTFSIFIQLEFQPEPFVEPL